MTTAGKPHEFNLLPKVVNGGIAGIIGVTCVFPLDLVKTRLQSQKIGPNGEKAYNSIIDCFVKTFRNDGFFGMYRGAAVNILLVTPEKAIKLSFNDFFRYHLTTQDGKLPIPRQGLAGALTGLFQIFVTTPMELLKIQMQDAGRVAMEAKKLGQIIPKVTALQITKDILRERGVRGLYKGLDATFHRDITFSVIYFPLFATLNDLGPRKFEGSNEAVFYWSFISGCASGLVSAISVTPFDVVKTRLQATSKAPGEPNYTGWTDCAVKTYQREGARAFFKGGVCRIIVIAPLFGVAQMIYYVGVAEYLLGYKK